MDYRALAELVWFALLGLSALIAVTGLSVRLFLAPVIREMMERLGDRRDRDHHALEAHLERMEARLADMESEVHRLRAAEDFHRQLEAGEEAEG